MSAGALLLNPSVVVPYIDPSEHYRPEPVFEKAKEKFRDYSLDPNDPIKQRVYKTYMKMHTCMTMQMVKRKIAYWTRFDKARLTIIDALKKLNALVDESDPDVDVPNIVHAFQTAERIREDFPENDWFQLVGLIHDVGKIMALLGEEQWCVVGDTFPVGCAPAPSIVYRDQTFHANPDTYNPKYNTRLGIYKENCGLENITMSWGHDEYMYRVLKNHGHNLPDEALYMIRFHSFYPWHSGGDYTWLSNEKDQKMLKWVKLFSSYDLYSKSDGEHDVDEIVPYYQTLIDKYLPGEIAW